MLFSGVKAGGMNFKLSDKKSLSLYLLTVCLCEAAGHTILHFVPVRTFFGELTHTHPSRLFNQQQKGEYEYRVSVAK